MNTAEAIEKTRKLLALANSANEHEAAAAAARAAEIMERHRITAAMVADAEQCEMEREEAFAMNDDIVTDRTHARTPRWFWVLAWGVARANRCMPRHRYIMGSGGRYGVTFVGRPSDAAAARYMLDAIARDVDRLGSAFVANLGKRAPRAAGKSFRLGAARTISERLDASAAETASQIRGELAAAGDQQGLVRLDRALVKRADDVKRLEQWAKGEGLKYTTARAATVSNADAYQAGKTAGANVNLRGGVAALGTGVRALAAGGAK